MKRIMLALALTACGPEGASTSTGVTTTPAPAAALPARLETLTLDASGARCTADGLWCATTDTDATTFRFSFAHQPVATFHLTDGGHEIWTEIIRTPRADRGEDALVGISHTDQAAYSGGGGQAVQVALYPLSSSGEAPTPPQPALTFPSSAALDIRACFSPADTRARRDACSDQYNFAGTLSLDTTASPAKLVLVTEATTYPGRLNRRDDNTHTLAVSDLKTVRDETCSYRRVFTRGANGAYTPDAPLPACADYLQP